MKQVTLHDVERMADSLIEKVNELSENNIAIRELIFSEARYRLDKIATLKRINKD